MLKNSRKGSIKHHITSYIIFAVDLCYTYLYAHIRCLVGPVLNNRKRCGRPWEEWLIEMDTYSTGCLHLLGLNPSRQTELNTIPGHLETRFKWHNINQPYASWWTHVFNLNSTLICVTEGFDLNIDSIQSDRNDEITIWWIPDMALIYDICSFPERLIWWNTYNNAAKEHMCLIRRIIVVTGY